jgi:hypothetical protein
MLTTFQSIVMNKNYRVNFIVFFCFFNDCAVISAPSFFMTLI